MSPSAYARVQSLSNSLMTGLMNDLTDNGFQPSKAATLSEDDNSKMIKQFLRTTELVSQSLELEFSEHALGIAASHALSDINTEAWEEERNSKDWAEETAAVRKYHEWGLDKPYGQWPNARPLLVEESLEDRQADMETVLSGFTWAESWISAVKARRKDDSAHVSLPEPPSPTLPERPNPNECAGSDDSSMEDLSTDEAGPSLVAQIRRQQFPGAVPAVSAGITQRAINRLNRASGKPKHRADRLLDPAYRAKFPAEFEELSQELTGSGLSSVLAASSSREKDGQDTDMELE